MEKITLILAEDHAIVRNGIKMLLESDNKFEVIATAGNGEEALQQVKELQPDILITDIRMPVMNGIDATKALPQYSSKTKSLILSMHNKEDYVLQSIQAGAQGYLLKDSEKEEFIKAIETIHQGKRYFSSDISEVLVNYYLKKADKETMPEGSPANQPQKENEDTEEEAFPSKSSNQPEEYKEPVHEHPFDLTNRELTILQYLVNGMNNKTIANLLDKSIRTIETHRFNIMKKMGVNNVVELINKTHEHRVLEKK